MRLRTCILMFLSALGVSAVQAQIGIVADPNCSFWYVEMEPPGPHTIYITVMGAAPGQVFTGAEFQIKGLPAGWAAVAVPAADAVTIGDPFDGTGANIAFGTCRDAACCILYQVLVYPSTIEYDVYLEGTRRTPPTNPSFDCPYLVLCDSPVFTKICIPASAFCINHRDKYCGEIAVRTSSWSQVKALYRDASP